MNKIKTNQDLIQAWAENQISPFRGEINSLSFEGRKLYSYNKLIALIDKEGKAHFYEEGYSVTTSRHINLAKRIIAAKNKTKELNS